MGRVTVRAICLCVCVLVLLQMCEAPMQVVVPGSLTLGSLAVLRYAWGG